MLKHFSFILILSIAPAIIYAQESESEFNPPQTEAVHSLKDFLKGNAYGHFRNFLMATHHEGEIQDHWTDAVGGSLGYRSNNWKGFEFGLRGIYTTRLIPTDLTTPDPITGKPAKWENELYDITRPGVYDELERLEELYVRFKKKGFEITAGRIDINKSPLLLRRDGRMKGFVFRGAWAEWELVENHNFTFAWIDGVSPRGMTQWYTINEAIGLNNNGFQPDGTKAHYHESAQTHGIGVFNYTNSSRKDLKFQIWDYYFDRIYNTMWFQADYQRGRFIGGVQFVHQDPLTQQANLDYDQRFYQSDEHANVFCVESGAKVGRAKITGAYLHGMNTGRFLFPRELGRENFYVSQPRSWVDGLGDLDIYQVRCKIASENNNTRYDVRLQLVDAPEMGNYACNKYNISSYYQTTVTISHKFHKVLEGMEIMLLYVARLETPGQELTPTDIYYKNNFQNINLITNIHF